MTAKRPLTEFEQRLLRRKGMDHLHLGQDDVIFSDKKWQLSALSTRVALSLLIPVFIKDPELTKRFSLTKKEKEELFERLWQQRLAEGWCPEQEEPSAALGKSKAARRPKYCKELHKKTRYANMRAEIKARVWDSFDRRVFRGGAARFVFTRTCIAQASDGAIPESHGCSLLACALARAK